MPTFASHLIERLKPWGAEGNPGGLETSPELTTGPELETEAAGSASDLSVYLTALASMFEPTLELAQEVGTDGKPGYVPTWGRVMDPSICPNDALPWLAQFVGVAIPKIATEAEARTLVKGESGLERGTLGSIERACKRILGATPFAVLERTNPNTAAAEAYAFTVIIPTGGGAPGLKEAIEEVKPAGLYFGIDEVSNRWIEGTLKFSAIGAGKKWSEMVEPEY